MFHNKRIPLFSTVLSDENRGIFFVNIVLKIADAIRDGKPVPYRNSDQMSAFFTGGYGIRPYVFCRKLTEYK